jgi:molecular chaperone HscB
MVTDLPCRACGVVFDASLAPTHCAACGVVVEPHPAATPFARLGLPRPRFAVDDAQLERSWLQRSRLVHPDRYARRPDAERRAAAQQTAALNDAWRALRVPFDRAAWLVRSVGVVEPALAQALLVDFMEAREEAATSEAHRGAVVERSSARFHDVMARAAAELRVVDEADAWSTPTTELPRVRRAAAMLAEARTLARLVADLGGPALIPTLAGR